MNAALKQELLDKIAETDDENLLLLLNTDHDYFTHEGEKDLTDELSPEDLAELRELATEPDEKDTLSQDEFDEVIRQWRTKYPKKNIYKDK